ncbi:imelysin family protein [Microbulbifer aestuariivivens]|uniref:imelysin family protein n=1 Tax=Microbulbifer aestuariivivens TaxID=1908308 RepID=UPI0031E8C361
MTRAILGSARGALLLAALAGLVACDSERAEESLPDEVQGPAIETVDTQAAETLSRAIWDAGLAQVANTQAAVEVLNHTVEALLEKPSAEQLQAAKLAWLDAHREFAAALPYIRLAFAPGPLREQGRALQLVVDSWPAQPGYLDTVPGYSDSGIVNDTAVELTLTNLRRQHRLTAHEEASTGFHALEVMLWGPTSERAATDFTAESTGEKPEALAANRRRALTRLMVEALSEDVHRLAKRMPYGANDLSRPFLALDPVARLQQIRATHTQMVDEELLRRLPESSESDVESSRAADSKQALLSMLRTLQGNWFPASGAGMAALLLDRYQQEALAEHFVALEALLLGMEDPIELAKLENLARARQLLEAVAGLMSGTVEVPAAAEDLTPVSLQGQ